MTSSFFRRRLRVLHVGKFYPPHRGGMESHVAALCDALRHRVDLQVVVAGDSRDTVKEVIGGVPVQRLGRWFTACGTSFTAGLPMAIRNAQPDLIHVHLPNPAAVMACLVSGYRGHLVVTYHSDVVKQRVLNLAYEPLVHRLLRRSNAIIVASPNYLASSTVLQRHVSRTHVIPFGIRSEEFTRPDVRAVAQEMAQYGNRIVLGVGRLVYYKGFQHLIRAMSSVEGRLVLVGTGPLRAELESLAGALGIQERVVFAGDVSPRRLLALYHAAAVFVLPSVARSEAFGIVQLEAMAAGRPVINTTLDSGVPFVSRHGETGLSVPPGDSAALAGALNRLLSDPVLRARYGAAARYRVQREFHLDRMVQRTLDLYSLASGVSIAPAETADTLEVAHAEPDVRIAVPAGFREEFHDV